MNSKLVHIITMGCQMNVYDSEKMEAMLASMDYLVTPDVGAADLVLVNTCSIRDKAEHKVYSLLGRLAEVKRLNPRMIIGVGGCVAQQEGRRILSRAAHVDIVFGTFALNRLPELVERVTKEKRRMIDVGENRTPDVARVRRLADKPIALVTVMTGCDNFCTYCVVPYTRGREVSRNPKEILEEIRQLAEQGVKEVTLIGQNVNAYGSKQDNTPSFANLLKLVNEVDGIERIRFTTSHPKDLSDELISTFGTLDKLAPHLHLPVQSGSDPILEKMNRGYTVESYLGKVAKLRSTRPGIAISSDMIVGFPGEQDQDFDATLNLVRMVEFDGLFSFKYSDRPNAPAAKLSGKVSGTTKEARIEKLLQIQAGIAFAKNKQMVGTIQTVLIEGFSKKGSDHITGRTPCNKAVNFCGNEAIRLGDLVSIKITGANPHSLLGQPLEGRDALGEKGGIANAA